MNLIDEAKKEMQAALSHLADELKSIRSGRASPSLLDNVTIEVYGAEMRLVDVANVTAPEPRQLVITPYDANNVGAIAKSIEKANLPLQVIAEGNVVRIATPPMDEQMRKEMVKQCSRKSEEGKVSMRNVRRKYNDQARQMKSTGEMTEDELKRTEKRIQDLTDECCKKADELSRQKEQDILTV